MYEYVRRKLLHSSDIVTRALGPGLVARQKDLTPQTLMYAFMMTSGHTPLSGTKNAGHMQDDVDLVLRFQRGENILSDEEIETLSSLLGIG